jgi:protoporphyrinogen/coproporphyrinogen III oxidase
LRGGLQQMVAALVGRLDPGSLLTSRSVLALDRENQKFTLALSDGSHLTADEVVFATPAFTTAKLVSPLDPDLASRLNSIRYVSTATVSLGFPRSDFTHALNGFGFVVPRCEDRNVRACTWSSQKFRGRAPEGHVLLRAFVGGAGAEHLVNHDDVALAAMVRDELRTMMGLRAEPVLTRVYRWEKANPQYDVGHQARIAEIDARLAKMPGLHVAGGAYHGLGIPDCIENGARVAARILRT